jgi:hypothetical protein
LFNAIPLEHGELWVVEGAALPVAPDVPEAGDPPFAGRQQLLHGEFGRGVQIQGPADPVIADGGGREGMQMRLVARRALQSGRIHHEETLGRQVAAQRRLDPVARQQDGPTVRVDRRSPPRRDRRR